VSTLTSAAAEAAAGRPSSSARRPGRLAYLTRIARVYAHRATGPLSFWYEEPQVNHHAFDDRRQYFMVFQGKAAYRGPFDAAGVPLLDYHGAIGRQYNPIAIAQYGLARFNRWCITPGTDDERAWLAAANWLDAHLTPNAAGVHVWMHHFDWPYRELLRAPWYSGLAQGSGISLLLRAADATGERRFAHAALRALEAFRVDVDRGGVIARDAASSTWIEEYVVHPPSHILNGFIWALWGVYDCIRFAGSLDAQELFDAGVATLEKALPDYDTGRWSLYELHAGRSRMLASRYYHELHIVQLRVLERMTRVATFGLFADRWQRYLRSPINRTGALMEKAAFKLLHY
jgi:hypothetical protein